VTDPTLKKQIGDEMKASMKAGDKVRVGALRMLMAAIRTKEVKKRTESIEAFEAAGRTELVEQERAERDVLVPYAPPQVDETAVDALVDEAIAATGATSVKEIGRVMGAVMAKAKALGQVDGNLVQAKVRARLDG
jgi:uncharacterized protein YqeY